jgi:glyoxylase-like metal-dependent hydrolase (beta-lactamase superfamily II)
VRLLDASPPFPPGHPPQRDELPPTRQRDREIEILPGIFGFAIPGHTWGQQAIRFIDAAGQSVVFSADLIPTAHHVGAAYNMAYDVEPFTSTVTRRWFLRAALEQNWLLVLDHEPTHPLQRVRADDRGWYTLIPGEP